MTVLSRKLLNMCGYECLSICVCYSVIACMCMCFYGSFKGSECGGLPFHRMSVVVQLWSTARPYIWNTENTPGVLAPSVCWTRLSSVCVYTCVFWVHILCVRVCNSPPLCCTLCPWYFKSFWPHVMSVRCISRLQLDDRSERTRTEDRKGRRNGERGKQGG